MAVRAVGIDLADVSRMLGAMERTPTIVDRLFTATEIASMDETGVEGAGSRGQSAARLFSVKEAVMKALGLGLDSIAFTDIEVGPSSGGGVSVVLSGGAAAAASELGVARWTVDTHMVDGPLGDVAVCEVIAEVALSEGTMAG